MQVKSIQTKDLNSSLKTFKREWNVNRTFLFQVNDGRISRKEENDFIFILTRLKYLADSFFQLLKSRVSTLQDRQVQMKNTITSFMTDSSFTMKCIKSKGGEPNQLCQLYNIIQEDEKGVTETRYVYDGIQIPKLVRLIQPVLCAYMYDEEKSNFVNMLRESFLRSIDNLIAIMRRFFFSLKHPLITKEYSDEFNQYARLPVFGIYKESNGEVMSKLERKQFCYFFSTCMNISFAILKEDEFLNLSLLGYLNRLYATNPGLVNFLMDQDNVDMTVISPTFIFSKLAIIEQEMNDSLKNPTTQERVKIFILLLLFNIASNVVNVEMVTVKEELKVMFNRYKGKRVKMNPIQNDRKNWIYYQTALPLENQRRDAYQIFKTKTIIQSSNKWRGINVYN